MSSTEELALRCILPGFVGTSVPDWVRRRAAEGLGGVVLFARNVESHEQLAALNASLHSERPALLIAIDEEGGDVTRLEARTGSSYPGNLALGAAGDLALTTRVAEAMGSELAELGIDLDLAPDADVNTNPENPVIGVRSFGSNAESVARHTAAWVTGLQSAGVAACAKHFPGHGDTAVDSHLELPVAEADPHDGALEPFEAAIAAGVQAIMSAHIVVPVLDAAPATISRRIMTDLLRDELGFKGAAISDGLEMRALSSGRTVAEGAVLALIAGCDALCVGGGLAGEETVAEIQRAVIEAAEAGRLSRVRLEEAAARVDALAGWRRRRSSHESGDKSIGLEAARRALCRRGRVRVRDDAAVIRYDSAPSLASGRDMPWGIADALAARGVRVTASDHEIPGRDLVLVVRNLHRWPDQRHDVESLLERRPDAIVVEMGVPAYEPASAGGYIATYGAARVCAEAAAEVMRP